MTTLAEIQRARERITSTVPRICLKTPVIESMNFNSMISMKVGRDIRVVFKCEHLQPVGSFKVRGALNFALSLESEILARGLVTHSSGNHGAAVAMVGQLLRVPVKVVVPSNAPCDKIELIHQYGAEIIYCEPTLEDRVRVCRMIVNDSGMSEIPPFNHNWTMNGQGTLALEFIEDVPSIDTLVVAVGGCGMISGVLTAAKGQNASLKVFGAEPTEADDTSASLKAGYRRGPTDPTAQSICDALRVSPPGELCWEIISGRIDGVFTAKNEETVEAMRIIMRELKQIVEPSGAIATAVILGDDFCSMLKQDDTIKTIGVVLCGGNIDLEYMKKLI
jgi:threonine dehydratase